jgi:prepilin-type N-terminal cleavage/methylation domain-containing protein/prepilin-type processing-associated H-X9-DG protein
MDHHHSPGVGAVNRHPRPAPPDAGPRAGHPLLARPAARRYARSMRSGFTLVELLLVLAVILILVGLAMPVLYMTQRHSYAATCSSNLHQLGSASLLYENENHGWVPAHQHDFMSVHWTCTLAQYLDGSWSWNNPAIDQGMKVYLCPSTDQAYPPNASTTGYYVNYAIHEAASTPSPPYGGSYSDNHTATYNYYFLNYNRVTDPSTFVLFADADNSGNWYYEIRSTWPTDGLNGGSMVAFRHDQQANVVFLDGHTGLMDQPTFTTAYNTTTTDVMAY